MLLPTHKSEPLEKCERRMQRSVRYVFFGLIWMRAQLARNLARPPMSLCDPPGSRVSALKSLMRKCSLTSSLILFKRGQKINLRLGVAAERAYIISFCLRQLLSQVKAAVCHRRLSYLTYLPKIRGVLRGVQYFPAPPAPQKISLRKIGVWRTRGALPHVHMRAFPCRVSIWS